MPAKGSADERHRLFAREYIKDFNGARAARAVGYSARTARVAASRLLTNVNVQTLLNEERQKLAERLDVEQDEILAAYKAIAFFDIRDVMSWDQHSVTLKPSEDILPEVAVAIANIRQTNKGTIRVRFHDTLAALEALARIKGMFNDTGTTGGAVLVFQNLDVDDDE